MKYTVFGASGFIGSHVAKLATAGGHDVYGPARNENVEKKNLGHVIYCIGMTADFRRKPHQTIDAHVTRLQQILQACDFDTFTYLSSTRVYQHCSESIVNEETPLAVRSQDPGDLYNLSKLLGESILQSHGGEIRIARLSNVFGKDILSNNFLFSVLRDCVHKGHVELQQTLDSEKDYVDLGDVTSQLLRLGPEGSNGIYNLASGTNTTHRQLLDLVTELTGATVKVAQNAVQHSFPRINISRMRQEFQFHSRSVIEYLPALVEQVRRSIKAAA